MSWRGQRWAWRCARPPGAFPMTMREFAVLHGSGRRAIRTLDGHAERQPQVRFNQDRTMGAPPASRDAIAQVSSSTASAADFRSSPTPRTVLQAAAVIVIAASVAAIRNLRIMGHSLLQRPYRCN